MLVPLVCPLCRSLGAAPCVPCRSTLTRASEPVRVEGVDEVLALFDYVGAVVPLIAAVKYRNERASIRWLASEMSVLLSEPVDVLTWAPTSTKRRRERGYDQARLLASAVAESTDQRVRSVLRRGRGSTQTGRSRDERLDGVSFRSLAHRARTVVVVDDVVTSGATLSAAAFALREEGAERVIALVAARTPVRGRTLL